MNKKPIKNVSLKFSCSENYDKMEDSEKGKMCLKCNKKVIDFTNKNQNDLKNEIKSSKNGICGKFKKSQLKDSFVKYAAATLISTASLITEAEAQSNIPENISSKVYEKDDIIIESVGEVSVDVLVGDVVLENIEHSDTKRINLDSFIGGRELFYKVLENVLLFPKQLEVETKVYVELTVDTAGHVSKYHILKGFYLSANEEALRALKQVNPKFIPAEERGKRVASKLIIPVVFKKESTSK